MVRRHLSFFCISAEAKSHISPLRNSPWLTSVAELCTEIPSQCQLEDLVGIAIVCSITEPGFSFLAQILRSQGSWWSPDALDHVINAARTHMTFSTVLCSVLDPHTSWSLDQPFVCCPFEMFQPLTD